MKGFEIAQGGRDVKFPSGLGPSLGPIINRVPGPSQEVYLTFNQCSESPERFNHLKC